MSTGVLQFLLETAQEVEPASRLIKAMLRRLSEPNFGGVCNASQLRLGAALLSNPFDWCEFGQAIVLLAKEMRVVESPGLEPPGQEPSESAPEACSQCGKQLSSYLDADYRGDSVGKGMCRDCRTAISGA